MGTRSNQIRLNQYKYVSSFVLIGSVVLWSIIWTQPMNRSNFFLWLVSLLFPKLRIFWVRSVSFNSFHRRFSCWAAAFFKVCYSFIPPVERRSYVSWPFAFLFHWYVSGECLKCFCDFFWCFETQEGFRLYRRQFIFYISPLYTYNVKFKFAENKPLVGHGMLCLTWYPSLFLFS